ncbi:MAG: AAA family ATPase, partial [Candidatus Asgardarchaeia archaeon]
MGAYISKIRCKNFKTFKNVTIDLIKGFQAIMGPNGSGKSNICDA